MLLECDLRDVWYLWIVNFMSMSVSLITADSEMEFLTWDCVIDLKFFWQIRQVLRYLSFRCKTTEWVAKRIFPVHHASLSITQKKKFFCAIIIAFMILFWSLLFVLNHMHQFPLDITILITSFVCFSFILVKVKTWYQTDIRKSTSKNSRRW